MPVTIAAPLSIVVTLAILGYNLFQLTNGYSWMASQIGQFRALLQEEQVSGSYLRRNNLLLIGSLLAIYLVLLFLVGFAWWVLGLVLCKYLASAWVSDRIQDHILDGREFLPSHHRWMKLDAALNVLVLGFLLFASVAGL